MTALIDRATALAEFLTSDEAFAYQDGDALLAACISRWPDLRPDEFERGLAIAVDATVRIAAEHAADVATLVTEISQRMPDLPAAPVLDALARLQDRP